MFKMRVCPVSNSTLFFYWNPILSPLFLISKNDNLLYPKLLLIPLYCIVFYLTMGINIINIIYITNWDYQCGTPVLIVLIIAILPSFITLFNNKMGI
jgi:uncharacterized membrane protein